MKKVIGTLISIAMTALLLSGVDNLVEFGFYIKMVINISAWFLIFAVGVKEPTAGTLRKNAWIDLPLSIFSVYALIYSGHTILAASVFISSAVIMVEAFRNKVSPA